MENNLCDLLVKLQKISNDLKLTKEKETENLQEIRQVNFMIKRLGGKVEMLLEENKVLKDKLLKMYMKYDEEPSV